MQYQPLIDCGKQIAAGLLVLTLASSITWADPAIGPIISKPTHQVRPGKVVWIDLVTRDVAGAASFYRNVFGWEISQATDSGYATVSHQEEPIAAITSYADAAPEGEAQWLISISVPDVDEAAALVRLQGGEVLDGPTELPDRGRYILVRDPTGAALMFLQASGGDPDDKPATHNEWLWAELWTDQPQIAVDFYENVVGYRSVLFKDTDGSDIQVMGRDEVPRATVVTLPWETVKPNWLAYIRVDDVEQTLASIVANSGKVLIRPAPDAGYGDVAIVEDPTGGVFAIQRRDDK